MCESTEQIFSTTRLIVGDHETAVAELALMHQAAGFAGRMAILKYPKQTADEIEIAAIEHIETLKTLTELNAGPLHGGPEDWHRKTADTLQQGGILVRLTFLRQHAEDRSAAETFSTRLKLLRERAQHRQAE